MLRAAVKFACGSEFDNLAQVHHRDPFGDVANHSQIVTDEKVCEAQFFLQVLQQVDHLGLD